MSRPGLTKRLSNFTYNSLNKVRLTKVLMFKLRTFLGYEYYRSPQIDVDKRIFGSKYGGHCVALNHLDENSVVYSAGLGLDLSLIHI